MVCKYCNSELSDGAKFCTKCGKKIEIEKIKVNVCKKCGKELKQGSKFCIYCGTPVDADKAEVPDKLEVPNKSEISNKSEVTEKTKLPEKKAIQPILLICAALLLLFVLAGGGVYFILSLADKNDTDNKDVIVVEADSREIGKEAAETTEAVEPPQTESTEADVTVSDLNADNAGNKSAGMLDEEDEEDDEEDFDEYDDSDYIIPNSDTVLLTEDDVRGLSLQEINYAKNEIYARHGRKFDSKELQNYFNSKSWYNGTIKPKDFDRGNYLSSVENKNAALLSKIEKEMGTYELDQ